jgi:hypothetical protein
MLFDLDGSYALDESGRIGKRMARLEHLQIVLRLNDANLEAVRRANDELHEEFRRLEPYWLAGMTKAEAIAAYHAANPGPSP